MLTITITKEQARRFLLAHQGLWPPYGLRGKAGVLSYIGRVGCVQFDPLDKAGQSPDLVLQARIADFRPAMLQELLYTDRKLLDGLDKVMSIYRVEDWPYFSRYREEARAWFGGEDRPATAVLDEVRKIIEERGPVSSADLDFNQTVNWSWAPTRLSRAVLESMYFWGELIVHHKVRNRKVYDFAWRHIPQELLDAPEPNVTEEEYLDWRVYRRIGGIGLLWNKSGDAWIGIPGAKSKERDASLKRLMRQEKVLEVQVEGVDVPFYIRSMERPLLDEILTTVNPTPRAVFLAPLDNLLWDRRMIRELFGFEYRWEVYKPAEERSYGYYVLPVLYGDRFVARMEPVFNKKEKSLSIQNWWWEPQVHRTKKLQASIDDALQRYCRFLGAKDLVTPQQ